MSIKIEIYTSALIAVALFLSVGCSEVRKSPTNAIPDTGAIPDTSAGNDFPPEPVLTLTGHTHEVTSVAFHPDGLILASGGWHNDCTVKLWRMPDGSLIRTLYGHTRGIESIGFSPDGTTLATASADHEIRLWNVVSGECTRILKGHTGPVGNFAFGQDGLSIISGGGDSTIRVWNLSDGDCVQIMKTKSSTYNLAISPDGYTLVSQWCMDSIKVYLFDGEWYPSSTLGWYLNYLKDITFSPDGLTCTVVNGRYDQENQIRSWRVPEWTRIEPVVRAYGQMQCTKYTQDNDFLIGGGGLPYEYGWINIWHIPDNYKTVGFKTHKSIITSLAISKDNKYMATASYDRTIKIWTIDSIISFLRKNQ